MHELYGGLALESRSLLEAKTVINVHVKHLCKGGGFGTLRSLRLMRCLPQHSRRVDKGSAE